MTSSGHRSIAVDLINETYERLIVGKSSVGPGCHWAPGEAPVLGAGFEQLETHLWRVCTDVADAPLAARIQVYSARTQVTLVLGEDGAGKATCTLKASTSVEARVLGQPGEALSHSRFIILLTTNVNRPNPNG